MAELTLEHIYPSVQLLMCCQFLSSSELLGAMLTLEHIFPSVELLVRFQTT